jgi:transposase
MAEQPLLIPDAAPRARVKPAPRPAPRGQRKLRGPGREQAQWRLLDFERLIGPEHPARAIWALTQRLDLERFAANIRSHQGEPGRSALDPGMLVAIWLYAYGNGVGSSRAVARQCEYEPGLLWLSGGKKISHATLSNFRTQHCAALDKLFSELLALLDQEGVIDLEQVMIDGTRLRSQGSASSRRRRKTIEESLEQARQAVQQLGDEKLAEQVSARTQAARQRAAQERIERLQRAAEELDRLERQQRAESASRESQSAGELAQGAAENQTRVSTTEPEARLQRESNGGYGLGYNAQLATESKGCVVLGVELSSGASDAPQLEATLADVKRRMGRNPQQAVVDAGYSSRENVVESKQSGIELVAPATALRAAKTSGYGLEQFHRDEAADTYCCPAGKALTYQRTSKKRRNSYRQYQARLQDCSGCTLRALCSPKAKQGRTLSVLETPDPVMEAHREWMQTERAKQAYRKRSQVAEYPNAELKQRIGLRKFRLRGLAKAKLELLWAVLAYNARQWMRLVWKPQREQCALALAVAA